MRLGEEREGRAERIRAAHRACPSTAWCPNVLTLLALCAGMTAIRFAINGQFQEAMIAIIAAGIFDGLDGRLARLLKATSSFGAELDSLSDFISFGVAPAAVLYLWTMSQLHSVGWAIVLFFAVCCALRLARFNTQTHRRDAALGGAISSAGHRRRPAPGWSWCRCSSASNGATGFALALSERGVDQRRRAADGQQCADRVAEAHPHPAASGGPDPARHRRRDRVLDDRAVADPDLRRRVYLASIPLTIHSYLELKRAALARRAETVERPEPAPPPAAVPFPLGDAARPPNEWRH